MTAPDVAPPSRSSLRTIILAVVLVVGGLVVGTLVAQRSTRAAPDIPGSGTDLPRPVPSAAAHDSFALPHATLEGFAGGPAINLTDLRGKPAIVNFWATWCAPCVKEMPEFAKASEAFGDKVTFLGVDVEDSPINAEPFVERLGIDYPLAIDPQREFYLAVGNFGMPTTLFVDPDGIVRYRHTGPLDRQQLRSLAVEHLNVGDAGASDG